MTKFAFALLMTAFVSTGAMAQVVPGAVGVVQSTDGLVTVSQGNTLGNAFINERIFDGGQIKLLWIVKYSTPDPSPCPPEPLKHQRRITLVFVAIKVG